MPCFLAGVTNQARMPALRSQNGLHRPCRSPGGLTRESAAAHLQSRVVRSAGSSLVPGCFARRRRVVVLDGFRASQQVLVVFGVIAGACDVFAGESLDGGFV